MGLNLLSLWKSDRPASRRPPAAEGRRFRPTLETLEGREVPSAAPVAPALGAPMAGPLAPPALPLSFNGVLNQNGQLLAVGQVGVNPFTTPLTLTAPSTSILHLQLAPIHLDLLGLNVETSQICLDINATPGPGNLLGNLLSGVANALNGGTPLSTVLSQNPLLPAALTFILNAAASDLTAPSSVGSPSAAQLPPNSTELLHLSLGPVNLNLLGLGVTLDNCANGPATVDVFAQSGSGDLLGNLLTDVANLLNPPGNSTAGQRLLAELADAALMVI